MGAIYTGKCPSCQEAYSIFLETENETSKVMCQQCGGIIFDYKQANGYVYFATNDYIPGLVKIGKTDRDIALRMSELSSASGVPGNWKCIAWVATVDSSRLESDFHIHLKDFREGKEFFKINLQEINSHIKEVGKNHVYHFDAKQCDIVFDNNSTKCVCTNLDVAINLFDSAIVLTDSNDRPGYIKLQYCLCKFEDDTQFSNDKIMDIIQNFFPGQKIFNCILVNDAEKIFNNMLYIKSQSAAYGIGREYFRDYGLAEYFISKFLQSKNLMSKVYQVDLTESNFTNGRIINNDNVSIKIKEQSRRGLIAITASKEESGLFHLCTREFSMWDNKYADNPRMVRQIKEILHEVNVFYCALLDNAESVYKAMMQYKHSASCYPYGDTFNSLSDALNFVKHYFDNVFSVDFSETLRAQQPIVIVLSIGLSDKEKSKALTKGGLQRTDIFGESPF